jgi:hypothetical protein
MAAPTPEDIRRWPVPNYGHPHEPLNPAVHGVNIALIALMTLFIAGRFYSRTFIVRNALGIDNWTMLVAYVRQPRTVGGSAC